MSTFAEISIRGWVRGLRPLTLPSLSQSEPLQPLTILNLLGGHTFFNHGVGGGHAGDGDAHGGAGDVVQADAVAEFHGLGLPAVFAADADLEVGPGLAPFGDGNLHEPSH